MASVDAASSTKRLLSDAGIGVGMRVLDLGCGAGDVTRMVGELVGDAGEVVGADRNARAIAKAKAETDRVGVSNVTFVEGDLGRNCPRRGTTTQRSRAAC